MNDFYLKADSESSLYAALESAGVATLVKFGRPVLVTDSALELTLDQQALDADLQCEYQGKTYWAADGKWHELQGALGSLAPGFALDVIGTIMQPIGTDANGEPIMSAIPGFHANLRGELTPEQEAALPVIPMPVNPVRVWA